jgi:hypothetical protein
MLSATIGLIVGTGAAAADAEASAGLDMSASATPTEVIFIDTLPSIVTLPITIGALDETNHHVKARHEIPNASSPRLFPIGLRVYVIVVTAGLQARARAWMKQS